MNLIPVLIILRAARAAIRPYASEIVIADEGEGFVDVLVKMLIVVVVGAVLMTIMRLAVPQMFTDMMDKVRDIFDL